MTATISQQSLAQVKRLYDDGKSAREIAEILGVSIDAVYFFLRKNSLPRRTAREQNALRFKNAPPSFKIKKIHSEFDQKLFTAGVILYWGEGSKWIGEKSVDFANSDPQMVKIFVRFLREICGVEEKRLRCYIYCYQNQNIEEIVRFWSKLTNVPEDQFTKPYIRKDYKVEKIGKMPHGLIHIRYSDKKLLSVLRNWITDTAKYF